MSIKVVDVGKVGLYRYKGQLVTLVYMTYKIGDKQYCTIEMINKYGKKQRQAVQFDKLEETT